MYHVAGFLVGMNKLQKKGNKMKKILLLSFVCATISHATCYGSDTYKTCTDNNGNTYQIQTYGNTTQVNGSAANGHTWSETAQTYGNTTYINGRAASGNTWNETIQHNGNSETITGTDANGHSFSKTCYNGVS